MSWACAASTTSAIGWTVPTSLLAHITVTRATDPGSRSMDAAQASTSRRPSASHGQKLHVGLLVLGEPVQGVEHGVVLDGGGEDPGAPRVGVAAGPEQALDREVVGLVPPEVNTSSPGRQPRGRGDPLPGLLDDPGATRVPERAARTRCRPGELLRHRLDRLAYKSASMPAWSR